MFGLFLPFCKHGFNKENISTTRFALNNSNSSQEEITLSTSLAYSFTNLCLDPGKSLKGIFFNFIPCLMICKRLRKASASQFARSFETHR